MAKPTVDAEMQMQLALNTCHNVDNPNFSTIAFQFPLVNCQTLSRRFYKVQDSRP
jgi:hypothetical protein